MAQSSGPLSTGTTADRQLTDVLWRDLFGDEAGVVGDMNGTSYNLVLPSGSDVAQIGSANQLSTAKVAGFSHRIPAGSPEGITIPVASGAARTDIVSLRYDPAFTGQPGPVRLTRIAGTSSALPVYDDAPPGAEDLPLWAITRSPGQNLSQATVQRLFPRLVPSLELPAGAPLPVSSPIGTILRQGTSRYRRQLDNSNIPVWAVEAAESYYDEGAGGGTITTAATAPVDGASVSLPAGTYDIDFQMHYSLSISSVRTFVMYLRNGSTDLHSPSFGVADTGVTVSRTFASFRRVTLSAAATISLRASATATGGTQSMGLNMIRARRVN